MERKREPHFLSMDYGLLHTILKWMVKKLLLLPATLPALHEYSIVYITLFHSCSRELDALLIVSEETHGVGEKRSIGEK